MENKVILSKESNAKDIKRYFEAILKLSQSDDKFPVNLDEVWMLVYPRKDTQFVHWKKTSSKMLTFRFPSKMGKTQMVADQPISTNLPFHALNISSQGKFARYLRFIDKYSTR